MNKLLRINCISLRNYSSALYITGNKASSNFVLLTPHIDIEERIKDKKELKDNIKLRGLNINVDKLIKNWNFYKHLLEELTILDVTRDVIKNEISELSKKLDKNDEINSLKEQAKFVKSNYSNLKEYIYPVEESTALDALSLPNVLHPHTPHKEDSLIYSIHEELKEKTDHHMAIALDQNLLHYLNPYFYFLKDDAARFEYSTMENMKRIILDNSFTYFINPSFVRSTILEGCCEEIFNPQSIFTVQEDDCKYSVNKLHFVGGATLYAFMAYFTKFSIQNSYFPVRLFTTGKQYKPVTSDEKSFCNLSQYSAVEAFVATPDRDDCYMEEFEKILDVAKQFYNTLDQHYRMVYLSANKLKNYQSLCVSIQMYSPCAQSYVEVGNVSLCDTYLSKRLLVTYKDNKTTKFSRIISGSLFNVQKALACILENNSFTNKKLKIEFNKEIK